MRLWRLARRVHPALDGEGARLFGGRWNSPGIAAVYTSTHLSLAVLEQLVHLDPDHLPDDYEAFEIDLPDDVAVERPARDALPVGWDAVPELPASAEYGDTWVAHGRAAALVVPSVVVPQEFNVLVNPRHADVNRVRVVSSHRFTFDTRLVSRPSTRS